ncbi:MAG TPA: ECF-type sigma factor [Phycisphaerae bacterium]|jgi:RNA polymerase sigma factor (TIGR02999 family)
MNSLEHEITRLLSASDGPDRATADRLLTLVYQQLRKIAQERMQQERAAHTLQATALVHEAYLRLVGDPEARWQGRAHFFAAAAEAMRRILVERARRRSAEKHGGGCQRVELTDSIACEAEPAEDVVAISEALERLSQEDPRKAELVKLRYFAGLTIAEAADAMGISHATAERYWAYSRLKLYQWIHGGPSL